MTAEERIAALDAEIKVCARCRLWQTRTQSVPGVGSARAAVMLVGEAPGAEEDRRGEPFVGAAGRVLNDLLALAGLTRDEVYITNVVKSRPTAGPPPRRNRAPRPDEIEACSLWLEQQLEIIRPRLVVALGGVATAYLLGAKITAVRGRLQRRGDLAILPTYHPASTFHRPDHRADLERDFRSIPRILRDLAVR